MCVEIGRACAREMVSEAQVCVMVSSGAYRCGYRLIQEMACPSSPAGAPKDCVNDVKLSVV